MSIYLNKEPYSSSKVLEKACEDYGAIDTDAVAIAWADLKPILLILAVEFIFWYSASVI